MNIPKVMHHIWIGPKKPPLHWMNTWKEKHKDWQYTIFDNDLLSNTTFHNQHLIDQYLLMPNHHGYAGAADLIRYELLYRHGGFIPPADACCYYNTDELWDAPEDYCYTVYENERLRPSYVSPIYACRPENEFLKQIIDELHKLSPEDLKKKAVYLTTGNGWLPGMISKHKPKIKIFPSHYFIPTHYSKPEERYKGMDKIYSEQYWGSTKGIYK